MHPNDILITRIGEKRHEKRTPPEQGEIVVALPRGNFGTGTLAIFVKNPATPNTTSTKQSTD